jgi:hypothetical protein
MTRCPKASASIMPVVSTMKVQGVLKRVGLQAGSFDLPWDAPSLRGSPQADEKPVSKQVGCRPARKIFARDQSNATCIPSPALKNSPGRANGGREKSTIGMSA